jgi:integrase/recombinase XerD
MILTKATSDLEIINSWLNDKPSKLTQAQYANSIKQFVNFIGCELKDVKIEDLQQFKRMLELKGYKPMTIKNKLLNVKSFFSFAFAVGYLSANVASLIKLPKVHRRTASMRIDHSEIKQLIDGARCVRDQLIIKMMYFLGLRVSEVLAIKWTDFFQQGNEVKVFICGKGNKERSLTVPSPLYFDLKGLKVDDIDYVFHANQNQMLTRQAVNMMLMRLKKKLGIDSHIHPHKFRHEHSMTALDNGCDIHLLSRSLGHSSVSVTEYYLKGRERESSSKFIRL